MNLTMKDLINEVLKRRKPGEHGSCYTGFHIAHDEKVVASFEACIGSKIVVGSTIDECWRNLVAACPTDEEREAIKANAIDRIMNAKVEDVVGGAP